MHVIDYNPIVKELIKLAKKLNYHFTHYYFLLKIVPFFAEFEEARLQA